MQDRPTAAELLGDIAELLEGETLQATTGALRHKIRVAGNLCRILAREVAQAPAGEERERELLAELLGQAVDGRSTVELNGLVAERLDGEPARRASHTSDSENPDFERDAWRAIVEIVRSKLAIVKPGHDSYDFAGEQQE